MRIVDFDTFVKLPPGTVFSFYEPDICTGLHVLDGIVAGQKGEMPGDFFYTDLTASCWNGDPPTCQCLCQRDGMFDYSRQFAIYEEEDLKNIREKLGW